MSQIDISDKICFSMQTFFFIKTFKILFLMMFCNTATFSWTLNLILFVKKINLKIPWALTFFSLSHLYNIFGINIDLLFTSAFFLSYGCQMPRVNDFHKPYENTGIKIFYKKVCYIENQMSSPDQF